LWSKAPELRHGSSITVTHRNHEVCHVVGHVDELRFLFQPVGDHQGFVLDGVHQTAGLFQKQIQGTAECDAINVNAHGLSHRQAFSFNCPGFHCDVDSVVHGNLTNHIGQGHIMEVQRDFLAEAVLDLQFTFRAIATVCPAEAFTAFLQFFP